MARRGTAWQGLGLIHSDELATIRIGRTAGLPGRDERIAPLSVCVKPKPQPQPRRLQQSKHRGRSRKRQELSQSFSE